MNKTKKLNKYLPLIITISLVLMIGVTFAWLSFRASKQSDLSVTKVALNVTFDMEDSLSGVATGDTIVDSITFSPVANAGDCYVRAQVAFDTQNAPSDD